MKQDFAYGAIVFRKEDGVEKVLLVKKPQFTSWDLPKGHKEGEEDDKAAALREVSEETGYKQITILDENVSVTYEAEKNGEKLQKTVTFYLGELTGNEVSEQHLDEDEDEQGMEVKWVPTTEAVNLLLFAPFKSALEQAIEKRNFSNN